ncbi:TPA: hypothetical protein MIP74_25020 [Klebsiella pneumoniae]|nr:hypothetical protein [Klebsiella pneumoniae]HBY1121043.1 hypothetical protein [Klebsiella pneumoniae]
MTREERQKIHTTSKRFTQCIEHHSFNLGHHLARQVMLPTY